MYIRLDIVPMSMSKRVSASACMRVMCTIGKRAFAQSNFVGIILHEEKHIATTCFISYFSRNKNNFNKNTLQCIYNIFPLRIKLFQKSACKDTFLIHIIYVYLI